MSEWISVLDDVPDLNIEVITYDFKFPADGFSIEQRIGDDDWSESYSVTHWMPLPEPPK